MKNIILKHTLAFVALTSISFLTLGQTGPGGVGNSTNNVVWLDASVLTGFSNGQSVATWTDTSGNSNNATQTIAADQPTYQSAAINGKPALDFDGTSEMFWLDNNINSATQSIFAIVKASTPTSLPWRFLFRDANYNVMSSKSNNKWGYVNWSNNHAFAQGGILYSNSYKIISMRADSANSFLEFSNNGAFNTLSYIGTNPSFSKTSLGSNNSFATATANDFFKGDIAEFIVYNSLVNDAQKVIITNYLSNKYNIGISTPIIYNFTGYRNQVAGIGQAANGDTQTDSKGSGDIEISNPTALANNKYLMFGNNDGNYNFSSDMPFNFSGERWNKLWRIKEYGGGVGHYNVRVYLGSHPIGTNTNTYYLVYDQNDGIFNDGSAGKIGPGVYNSVTNTVLFSNVHIPNNAWFTLANSDFSFTTVQSGNWDDTATWSCSCVPGATDIVTILNGHTVTVDSNQNIKTLTIDSGGTLTFSGSDTLFVKGNFNLSGSFNVGTSTIDFSGTIAQFLYNYTNGYAEFYNLVIDNSFYLRASKGKILIDNNLSMLNGKLQNVSSGYVILNSTSSSTANITTTGVSNPFSGNFSVRRYIGTRAAAWSDWSSPMSASNIGIWDNSIYMSGVNGNDGNSIQGGQTFYSVYTYNAATQSYDSVTSTSTSLTPTEGFELWLADNQSAWNGKTIWTVGGVPNTGNVSANAFLPSGNGQWGFIGNPYASWIDWANVTKTNLPNEVWIYSATAGNYVAHNGGSVPIPTMQGFWVQASGANPTATFTESSKINQHASTFNRKKNFLDNELILHLAAQSSSYADDAHIRFIDNTTLGKDFSDAALLRSPDKNAPNITTQGNYDTHLMVNSFDPKLVDKDNIIIPVNISVKQNDGYDISFTNIASVFNYYNYAYFVDKNTGNQYDLSVVKTVHLNLQANDYSNRFELHFSNTPSGNNNNLTVNNTNTNNTYVFENNGNIFAHIHLNKNESATINIYNSLGQKVGTTLNTNNSGTLQLKSPSAVGVYIVRIVTSNQAIYTQKVVNK